MVSLSAFWVLPHVHFFKISVSGLRPDLPHDIRYAPANSQRLTGPTHLGRNLKTN